jgi:hypothetical protein
MPAIISEDEFLDAVRTFSRTAFRLETRDSYALGYERADFEAFLAGSPVPPSELDWWRPWLDRVTQFGREGKTVSRVRVLAEPPTDYQRWMLWSTPWHEAAGEDIRYLPRRKAYEIGLPDADWWLLDNERAIIMAFDDDGNPVQKTLVTEPDLIARYRKWRDLAVRHATPARQIAAA